MVCNQMTNGADHIVLTLQNGNVPRPNTTLKQRGRADDKLEEMMFVVFGLLLI